MNRLLAGALVVLAGCAGYAPTQVRVGAGEGDVVQAMGQPTGRYTMPDGRQRLEYARGPYGRHTYMIDLDAQGRVARVDQVLDARHFATISPGISRDEVLRTLGRPSERQGMFRDGQIWSWRYFNNDCLWYQAQFDAQGVLTSAGYGIMPGCDAPNDKGR
jgi:hypothetical protein